MKAKTLPEAIRGYNKKSRKGYRITYFNHRSEFPFIMRYPSTKKYYPSSSRQTIMLRITSSLYRFFYHYVYPTLCRREQDPPGVSTGVRPPEPWKLSSKFVRSNVRRLLATIPVKEETPTKIIYKFPGIDAEVKPFNYKPIKFKDFPYFLIDIAADVSVALTPHHCALVSSVSNILTPTLVNDPKYIGLQKLISNGELVTMDTIENALHKDVIAMRKKLKGGYTVVQR